MTDIIRIKRSDATATPSSLAAGELAYSEQSGNFFYGRIADGAPVIIGGKTDHDKLAGIESGAEVNLVQSVAGRTGDVTIVAADVSDFSSAADARIGLAELSALSNVNAPSPSDQQVLTWDAGSGKWVWAASGSGVTAFIALNDTPANFSGSGGYMVKVNAGGTALEFANGVDGGTF
jgi:hypothetical protein